MSWTGRLTENMMVGLLIYSVESVPFYFNQHSRRNLNEKTKAFTDDKATEQLEVRCVFYINNYKVEVVS